MKRQEIKENSPQNQKIKGHFVNREVYANVNNLVEYVLNKGFEDSEAPFSIDDIENMYRYEYETTIEEEFISIYSEEDKEEALEKIDLMIDHYAGQNPEKESIQSKITELEDARDEIENLEEEPQEIFEWWIVSKWLYDKLKQEGEPVIDDGLNQYWGRTGTGQAILLDSVISDIAIEMEILEGQENEWKL